MAEDHYSTGQSSKNAMVPKWIAAMVTFTAVTFTLGYSLGVNRGAIGANEVGISRNEKAIQKVVVDIRADVENHLRMHDKIEDKLSRLELLMERIAARQGVSIPSTGSNAPPLRSRPGDP